MMPNPVASQIQTQSTHRNNRQLRNTRPSSETTPPPLQQQSSHQPASQGSGTIYMNNDIMGQTIKNFEDVSFVDQSAHMKHKMMKARMNKDNWFRVASMVRLNWLDRRRRHENPDRRKITFDAKIWDEESFVARGGGEESIIFAVRIAYSGAQSHVHSRSIWKVPSLNYNRSATATIVRQTQYQDIATNIIGRQCTRVRKTICTWLNRRRCRRTYANRRWEATRVVRRQARLHRLLCNRILQQDCTVMQIKHSQVVV